MIELEVRNNNLHLIPEDIEELQDYEELYEILEMSGYIGNGTYYTVASVLNHLSEADVIIFEDKTYYLETYMFTDVVEELQNNKTVIFTYLEDTTSNDYNILLGEY